MQQNPEVTSATLQTCSGVNQINTLLCTVATTGTCGPSHAQLALQALERQWEAQSVSFASYWIMKRLFWRWRQVHSQQATATVAKLTAAAAFAFQNTSGMVFTRWQQFVELQRERRRRLQAAFVSIMEADDSSRLRLCFERWQNYQRQGQLLSAKSDVVLQLSQRRILQVSVSAK